METVSMLAVSAALLAAAFANAAAQQGEGGAAATPPAFTNTCDRAVFSQFDFWVGDWVAFDVDTGVVQGIDRIEKINNGCVIFQDWSQMTDRYRAPGSPYRYAGISFSTVVAGPDGPGWQQSWISNSGGLVTLTGGLDEAGTMVIETPEYPTQNGRVAKRIWYWDPEPDGTIHSWGEIYVRDPDGEYDPAIIPWNLRYVPRADVGNLTVSGG